MPPDRARRSPACEPSWCAAARAQPTRSGLDRAAHHQDWRARPSPSPISDGGQRTLRTRCVGGSRCPSFSLGLAWSRSRRSSSMRARIVAKSSAARGRFTLFLPWSVAVLTPVDRWLPPPGAIISMVNSSRKVSAPPVARASAFPGLDEDLTGSADDLRRRQKSSFATEWEDQMPSLLQEALEWLDRAEQAREVAGQVTDPAAKRAVLELAESFDRLARAAATPAVVRRRELARQGYDAKQ